MSFGRDYRGSTRNKTSNGVYGAYANQPPGPRGQHSQRPFAQNPRRSPVVYSSDPSPNDTPHNTSYSPTKSNYSSIGAYPGHEVTRPELTGSNLLNKKSILDFSNTATYATSRTEYNSSRVDNEHSRQVYDPKQYDSALNFGKSSRERTTDLGEPLLEPAGGNYNSSIHSSQRDNLGSMGSPQKRGAHFSNYNSSAALGDGGSSGHRSRSRNQYLTDGGNANRSRHRSGGQGSRSGSRSRSKAKSRSPEPPPPSYEDSLTKGTVGLENMGNTCYFNSAIQCISNTADLRDAIIGARYQIQESSDTKGRIIMGLRGLLNEVWCASEHAGSLRPRDFLKAIANANSQFEGYRQQDSQELLLFVLNALSEETNRVKSNAKASERRDSRALVRPKSVASLKKDTSDEAWRRFLSMENSFVTDVVAGQLQSALTCKICMNPSITYESFFQLSLPIPENMKRGVTLNDCFKLFCADEVLDGDNKVLCEVCRRPRECGKSFQIERLPKVLIIQLKRFSLDFVTKIHTPVVAPLNNLCLVEYMSSNQKRKTGDHSIDFPVYRLYAVIDHMGSAKNGHYVAKCLVPPPPHPSVVADSRYKTTLVLSNTNSGNAAGSPPKYQVDTRPKPDTWWEFDDSRVRPISEETVVCSDNYILFYEMDQSSA